jgi:hypothetical protein
VKGLCTVLTKDGGVRHFAAHEPVLVSPNTPLNINFSTQAQPDGSSTAVRLRVCTRCGITFLDGVEKTFAEKLPTPSTPPEGVH